MDKPDWTYWLNLPEVEVPHACALSCDVSPRALNESGDRYVRADEVEIRREYSRRCTFASEAIKAEKLKATFRGFDRNIPYVTLEDFRVWGELLQIPLTFPEQFPAPALTEAMRQRITYEAARKAWGFVDPEPAKTLRFYAGSALAPTPPAARKLALPKSVFTLPDGELIEVPNIPELLADAKYPDTSEPARLHGIMKREGSSISALDEADIALLESIWRDLPAFSPPMDMTDWERYAETFTNAPSRPVWALELYIDDPQEIQVELRRKAKDAYLKAMIDAIRKGTLQVRAKLTGEPVPPETLVTTWHVVTRDELKKFASEHLAFTVVDNPAPMPPQESDTLDPRTESSYLLVVRALLELANMSKKTRNEAKTIMGRLAKLKLKALERKTIGKVLAKARSLQ